MARRQTAAYLERGRLADVLALIQVLALDEHAHRSEDGLTKELQTPRSADTWTEIAEKHPEFFRVAPSGEHRVSLVARHVTPRTADGQRGPLSPEYTSKLLELAVELHDRELRRAQQWHVWIPLIVGITAGAFTLFGVLLKGILGDAS